MNNSNNSNNNSNKSKNNHNAEESKTSDTCVVTRSMKSFIQAWSQFSPNVNISLPQAILAMTAFRSQRVKNQLNSPLGNMSNHSKINAYFLNIEYRIDVNHRLILAFVDDASHQQAKEEKIQATTERAAIQWAETIIV